MAFGARCNLRFAPVYDLPSEYGVGDRPRRAAMDDFLKHYNLLATNDWRTTWRGLRAELVRDTALLAMFATMNAVISVQWPHSNLAEDAFFLLCLPQIGLWAWYLFMIPVLSLSVARGRRTQVIPNNDAGRIKRLLFSLSILIPVAMLTAFGISATEFSGKPLPTEYYIVAAGIVVVQCGAVAITTIVGAARG